MKRFPHSITPEQAKRTLVSRLNPIADRIRQKATDFGVRPYRCFLTWTVWVSPNGGPVERGEGNEVLYARLEILPTPRVASLDAVSFSLFHAGTVPVGSVKVDRISGKEFTADILLGKAFPNNATPMGESPVEKHIPQPFEFFYEVVEDGRGDNPAKRERFRPLNIPMRRAGQLDWSILLERVSLDRTRDDRSGMDTELEG